MLLKKMQQTHKKIITCCSSQQKQPMCIVTPPSNNICNHLFSIAPRLCLVFYGPRLLSKMSGRKHLRCSLGLFVPAGSNHLAKLRPRNNPQIGPFLGQSCLFVCLPSSYLLLIGPMLTIYRKIESLNPGHTPSFIFLHILFPKQKAELQTFKRFDYMPDLILVRSRWSRSLQRS